MNYQYIGKSTPPVTTSRAKVSGLRATRVYAAAEYARVVLGPAPTGSPKRSTPPLRLRRPASQRCCRLKTRPTPNTTAAASASARCRGPGNALQPSRPFCRRPRGCRAGRFVGDSAAAAEKIKSRLSRASRRYPVEDAMKEGRAAAASRTATRSHCPNVASAADMPMCRAKSSSTAHRRSVSRISPWKRTAPWQTITPAPTA